ncbi:MAG: hypothetical protein ACLP29_06585 [Dissulfurispiraceae bacterium]|jgi:hypothetical protein
MTDDKLICVDCYERLESVINGQMTMHYCKNVKCRRFGVLTVGGLVESICEKKLDIRCEEGL